MSDALIFPAITSLLTHAKTEHDIARSLLYSVTLSTFATGGFLQCRIDDDTVLACGAFCDPIEKAAALRLVPQDGGDAYHDTDNLVSVFTVDNRLRIGVKTAVLRLTTDILSKVVILCETTIASLGHISSLDELYMLDELTGLPNVEALERDLRFIDTNVIALRPAAIMFIDINGFTDFNKNLGYHHGDEALRDIACSLRMFVGQHGKVYRLKGGQFLAVVKPGTNGKYEEIARKVQGVVHRADGGIQLTSTVGIAEYNGQPLAKMLKDAGMASGNIQRFFERRARAREGRVVKCTS